MATAGRNDIRTSTVALVGVTGALVIFAIVTAIEVLYYHTAARQFQDKQVDQPSIELRDTTARQQARLAEYRWMDPGQGLVALPIERAMQLVVRDVAAGKTGVIVPHAPEKPANAPPSAPALPAKPAPRTPSDAKSDVPQKQ